jgi:hypothetical protein
MSLIEATLLQAGTLQQLGENTGDRLLFRPGFQPFFRVRSAAWKLEQAAIVEI